MTDQNLPLTVRGELKNGVNWVLEHIIVRHVFLILPIMMLLGEKLPGVAWAEALSLLAQIIMYAILGSVALSGFLVLLLIGFWLVTCLFNLGLWALHLATGVPEGRDLGY